MNVPIEFKDAAHDTVVVFSNTFLGQSFSADLGFIPTQVIFDPALWILSGNDVVTKVDDPVQDNALFNLFPNPAANELQVYQVMNEATADLRITDASGKIVKVIPVKNKMQTGIYTVDISDLPPGIYFLTTIRGSIPVVKKFVKS
jgi:hypothetical protein